MEETFHFLRYQPPIFQDNQQNPQNSSREMSHLINDHDHDPFTTALDFQNFCTLTPSFVVKPGLLYQLLLSPIQSFWILFQPLFEKYLSSSPRHFKLCVCHFGCPDMLSVHWISNSWGVTRCYPRGNHDYYSMLSSQFCTFMTFTQAGVVQLFGQKFPGLWNVKQLFLKFSGCPKSNLLKNKILSRLSLSKTSIDFFRLW